MKIFLIIGIFTLSVCHISGQSFNFNQGEFVEKEYFIELPFEKIKGKIIVDIEVENQKLKFIVDTGAPTCIRKGIFEKLKLEVLSLETISDANKLKNDFRIAKINKIKLGNSIYQNIPVIVFDENILTECFEIDGLLGSNLFRNSVVQFDEKNKLIRISNSINKLDVSKSIKEDILIDKQSAPIIKLELGQNAKEMLLFDSGSDELYSICLGNMDKFKKTNTFKIISKSNGLSTVGFNGLEQESYAYRLLIPELKFSGLNLKNIIVESTSDVNSRMGSRLLQYGLLTIDYKNRESYFEPFLKETNSQETFWDISPTFIEGRLVVGRIWSKDLKNISVGDEIILINDVETQNMSDCDFLMNSPMSNIEVAILKIRNSKGKIEAVKIQKTSR